MEVEGNPHPLEDVQETELSVVTKASCLQGDWFEKSADCESHTLGFAVQEALDHNTACFSVWKQLVVEQRCPNRFLRNATVTVWKRSDFKTTWLARNVEGIEIG